MAGVLHPHYGIGGTLAAFVNLPRLPPQAQFLLLDQLQHLVGTRGFFDVLLTYLEHLFVHRFQQCKVITIHCSKHCPLIVISLHGPRSVIRSWCRRCSHYAFCT